MSVGDPEILHRSEWDRALFWMVLLSALVHVVAVVVIILLPDRFGLRAHPQEAYVVDLVSSDQLAGTNLVPGGKGKVAAPKKVEAKPPPPPPKVEEAKKEEPPPKKGEPKPPEKAAVAIAAATQPKPAAPTPTPVVEAKLAPSPTRPPAKTKAEAKKEEPKPEPTHVAVAKKHAAEKPARTPTLTKEKKVELAARERDEKIAKAIERVQQEGAGSGTGTGHQEKETGGGPLSLGTGQGPGGGVVMGIEYLMYRNQLETRLKQAWAWAGNRDLEAIVHFRIGEDGHIFDVRITKSSGDAAYDESVVRAVRAVSPLPPPPQAYRKEFSDVEYTFTPQNMG